MSFNNCIKEFDFFGEVNNVLDDFYELTLDNKKWADSKIKEKNLIVKNVFKIPNLQAAPAEISQELSIGRPKRKALLQASEKIREDSLCTNTTKLRRIGDTNEIFKKPTLLNKKSELITSSNPNPNVLQNISNLKEKRKKSTKILNSTIIKGKEIIPDFPNISIVESIEEQKEENDETIELTHELSNVSDNTVEIIDTTPKKTPILKKQTKKSSKELFNPYIINSVKKRVEAFEVLQENGVKEPSPEASKMPMRITRTKAKQIQEEQQTKKKIISSKVKKHSKSLNNKKNRTSNRAKQQINLFSPINDNKITKTEQDKIEKAIQKRNERLNLIKDDLKKKNNEKMLKAHNLREALEKEKQIKIRENEEKIIQQEHKKKTILDQKRLAEQEKKIELKKQQNLKKKKENPEIVKQNNQDEDLKELDDKKVNKNSSKKVISNDDENLRIKLLQTNIDRDQPPPNNNATFISQNQNLNSSYKLTPLKKKQNNEHTLQEEEIELDEDDDEEEDEEIDKAEKKFISKHAGSNKQVPIWAQYKNRNQNMLQQALMIPNLFGIKDLKNISKIFPGKKISRRSSAIWNTPKE